MIPKTSIPLYDEQDSVNAQKAIQENREKILPKYKSQRLRQKGLCLLLIF